VGKRFLLGLALAGFCHAESITGLPAPRLAPFDELVTSLLRKYNLPGAALAVVKDGRLVLAHGYGLADREKNEPVRPDSVFRIASLSKPFTAVAILQLVEHGKLRLDDRAFEILHLGEPADARLRNITVRELLQHSGGWDRDKSFDPMFIPRRAARAVGAPAPASAETVIRYMLTQPLQFDPGTAYSYSNFGYCVLGRIIEKVTGQSYESFEKSSVLAPMGITRMRLGHSQLAGRAPGEVKYYAAEAQPYGGFYIEAMDSHGGWIASAIDLVAFLEHLDGHLRPRPLEARFVEQMVARPAAKLVTAKGTWYGFGLQVRRQGRDANWWHTGSLDGTSTIMVRTADGLAWALLFNGSPKNDKLFADMDEGLWRAAGEVKQWPERDLFRRLGY
jgi:CubicO group peptidase (beta-lactamase class C family)